MLLWDNGEPKFVNGWNLGAVIQDDFFVASTRQLMLLDTYIYNGAPHPVAPGDLFIKIDDSDVSILSETSVLVGFLPGSTYGVFKVSFAVAAIPLSSGLHTLEVGSLSRNGHLAWVWTDAMHLQPSTVNGGLPSSYEPTDLAFQLYGPPAVVLLPAALPLFAGGLGGLGLLSWWRRRKRSEATC